MKIFSIILCLFSLVSCGNSNGGKELNNKIAPIEGWKMLDDLDYSIQHPPTWTMTQNEIMGVKFMIKSPVESDTDLFQENLNLVIQNLGDRKIDLKKYVEMSEKQVREMIPNYAFIEGKSIKHKGNNYYKLVYNGDYSGFHLKFEQRYWVKNDKAYVLTFTCEQAKAADYKNIGDTILNTFFVKK